ncbi:MAG: M23 family metallopeptidase [candidate division KSB1 bacterium]|nr:M23 family metallopeptidase [candidate division KSB1 bacterium]
MYIRPKQPSPRNPLVVAALVAVLSILAVFGYALLKQPDRLLAAFPLPELLTRTPTPLYEAGPFITPSATPTRRPTHTRAPTRTPTPLPTLAPTQTPYPVVQHFLLDRPVPADASSIIPDRSYLYGSTGRGEYEVHHGQEFVNPIGTSVLAVGDGVIVVAGPDDLPLCGAAANELCGRTPHYYGKVIILKLDQTYAGKPLYAVYGHLSRVEVVPGQRVRRGEPLGQVGQEGIALGPHLHFEVRYGTNSYGATRNPILWMRPLPGTGVLAGRLQDRFGRPIRSAPIIVYADDEEGTYLYDTETYARDRYPAVNADDILGENWALPDIPAGNYLVRAFVGGLIYSRRVTVEPGKLTFFVFSSK